MHPQENNNNEQKQQQQQQKKNNITQSTATGMRVVTASEHWQGNKASSSPDDGATTPFMSFFLAPPS
jgi:hypothetical protein